MTSINFYFMKLFWPTLLVGWILTGATYLYTHRTPDATDQQPFVTAQSAHKATISQIINETWTSVVTSTTPSNNNDYLSALLDKNLPLRMGIQGMWWYRDCLSGRLSMDECMVNIENAMKIEDMIKQKPVLLPSIQHETWW